MKNLFVSANALNAARHGECAGDSVWASIRRRTTPHAWRLLATSASRALHYMRTTLIYISVHGTHLAVPWPNSRDFCQGRRIRSVPPAELIRLCPAPTDCQILANTKRGVPDGSVLGNGFGTPCWNSVHIHLHLRVRVPRGGHGHQLVVLDQCYPARLVCKILEDLRANVGRLHDGGVCRSLRISQARHPVLHHDLVNQKEFTLHALLAWEAWPWIFCFTWDHCVMYTSLQLLLLPGGLATFDVQ